VYALIAADEGRLISSRTDLSPTLLTGLSITLFVPIRANYNGIVSIYYLGKSFSSCDDIEGITLAVEHLRSILAGLGGDRPDR
jgi:hypothetical protein